MSVSDETKCKVLHDAKTILSDKDNWTQRDYVRVTKSGYTPEPSEVVADMRIRGIDPPNFKKTGCRVCAQGALIVAALYNDVPRPDAWWLTLELLDDVAEEVFEVGDSGAVNDEGSACVGNAIRRSFKAYEKIMKLYDESIERHCKREANGEDTKS
jgi:hypothetical protein